MAAAEKIDWDAFLDSGPEVRFADKQADEADASGDIRIDRTPEEGQAQGTPGASTGRQKAVPEDDLDAFLSDAPVPDATSDEQDIDSYLDADVEETGTWEQMHYEFDKMPTASENAAIWLESRFPIGRIAGFDEEGEWFWYQSPEDTYGPDFMDLSPEQRRERIVDVRNKSIAEEHADVIAEFGEGGSGVGKVGMVAGALADPTTLIPITKSLKLATAATSLLGAVDTALYGLAQEGKIDPGNVAIGATAGALLPVTLYGAGKSVSKSSRGVAAGVQRVTPKGKAAHARARAGTAIMDLEDEIALQVAKGNDPAKAVRNAMDVKGLAPEELEKLVGTFGRKPKVPSPKHASEIAQSLVDGGVRGPMRVANPIDVMFGVLSTRIRAVSDNVANNVRWHEYKVKTGIHKSETRTHNFRDMLKSFKREDYQLLSKALMNGDVDVVERSFRAKFGEEGVESFKEVRTLLDEYKQAMKEVGYDAGDIENYFPRLVKDRQLLLSKLGAEQRTSMEDAIKIARDKAAADGRTLTKLEESEVINKFMRGYMPREKKPGFAKKRQITTVTDDMMEAYADPIHSLHSYIRKMTNDIEERRFFGRVGASKKAGLAADDPLQDRNQVLRESIGEVIRKEIASGGMRREDEDILKSMLSARFQYGNTSPRGWIQDTKNILYTATLSNPISAATQLGDVGLAMYINGFRNTMGAMFGRKSIDMREFGLDDIAQELTEDVRATSRVLDGALRVSVFKAVDRFGKNTLINGSLRRHRKMVKTPKGRKEFAKKYRNMLGDEMEQVMDDLATGKISENVKFLLWNDLSTIQPISLSEVPEAYLRNPDMRILYMLKTFTLKQMDIIRSTIIQQNKAGNRKQAFKNLVAFTTMFGTANMTSDQIKAWMLGEELDISDSVVTNLWGVIGINDYLRGNVSEGNIADSVKDTVAPPLRVFEDLYKGFSTALDGDTEHDTDYVKSFPVIGKLMHNWFLGGLEENEERKVKEQRTRELEKAR